MDRIKNLSLDQKAKLYYMALLQKGMIDRLPDDPKAAYVRDMMGKMEEGHSDAENKKLKKISKELNKASKMHKSQADRIDKITTEGDTYEKMAAKGKKRGNLKQGTVRKRLKIKDGEKIPLSKITKAISKIKKMKNPSEKNKKYLKALNLAKTLKTTTNVREMANELGYINEEEMYGFTVKGASFTYTEQGGMFYGVYLYDVPATANVQWREKIRSADEATKWLQSLGIQETVPRRYYSGEKTLDKIVKQLEDKGIVASHDDFFDVS